jgi:flagellar hook-associated protein 3 FlgL
MRLSTPTIFERGVNAMLREQAQLSKTELQLASGERVLSPEDDPVAASRILDLNREIDTINQHQRNLDRARSRLELEEAALDGSINLLQRVRELTVQGATDTLSAGDRRAIAQEVTQLRDELLGLTNTHDANGEYIFSGYLGDVLTFADSGGGNYVYQGDTGDRRLRIAYDREVTDGDNGQAVFGQIPSTLDPTGYRNVLNTLTQLSAALNGTAAPPNDVIPAYLDELDAALINIGDTRSRVGARLNAIDEQDQVHQDFLLVLEDNRSDEKDLDYAEAVSRFQQQLAALQASQQSFLKIQDLSLFKYL